MSEKEYGLSASSASRNSQSVSDETAHSAADVNLPRGQRKYKTLFGAAIDGPIIKPGDVVYDHKVQLLNEAILDVGMGRYQWLLSLVTGLGWFLDSFWMFSFTIIAPAVRSEAMFYTSNYLYLNVSQYVGLIVGSAALPMMSDFIGRRWIFNLTLATMGVAGLVGAGMPAFSGLCVVSVFMSIAAGANQAIDSAIFMESVPASHQYLLTMQGMYSGLGKLVAAAASWQLMATYSCGEDAAPAQCHYVMNMGWRYSWWTLGTITLFLCALRFCFALQETPKYLLSKGRDADAIKSLQNIAAYNGKQTWLTLEHFNQVDKELKASGRSPAPEIPETQGFATLRQSLRPFRFSWMKNSFATEELALSTGVLILIWSVIGIALPLHDTFISRYLEAKGVSEMSTAWTYRTYIFQGLCAIPGPIVASLAIETKMLGRKKTGAISSVLAGVFLFAFTSARSMGTIIAFSCVASFFVNIVVSLMYAYASETFATPIRGTGLGAIGFFYRIFGLAAAIVIALTSSKSSAPVWVSGALWIVAGLFWFVLPYETRAYVST